MLIRVPNSGRDLTIECTDCETSRDRLRGRWEVKSETRGRDKGSEDRGAKRRVTPAEV